MNSFLTPSLLFPYLYVFALLNYPLYCVILRFCRALLPINGGSFVVHFFADAFAVTGKLISRRTLKKEKMIVRKEWQGGNTDLLQTSSVWEYFSSYPSKTFVHTVSYPAMSLRCSVTCLHIYSLLFPARSLFFRVPFLCGLLVLHTAKSWRKS